jgi:hypothetical protein
LKSGAVHRAGSGKQPGALVRAKVERFGEPSDRRRKWRAPRASLQVRDAAPTQPRLLGQLLLRQACCGSVLLQQGSE